jgi:Tol biopolymer transport system component
MLALAGCSRARQGEDGEAVRKLDPPERLFSESPAAWFENFGTGAQVSPDGRWAIYGGWFRTPPRILDLQTGHDAEERLWPGLEDIRSAAFGPGGELLLLGTQGKQAGWFAEKSGGVNLLPVPQDAIPSWSPDGTQIAFIRSGAAQRAISAGVPGHERAYPTTDEVTGYAWLPDGKSLVVLTVAASGLSTLSRLALPTGAMQPIARNLDADPSFSPVAVAPDGRRAFLSLAGTVAPSPEARHRPNADRDLGIYEVDLATGDRRVVADTPAEEFAPQVAAGYLYWTSAAMDQSVIVVPSGGGSVRDVVDGAEVPTWRPDGREIGFAFGDWRLVDWALNWDAGVIDLDGTGKPAGKPRPFITGYHEDFPPVWSPDGRWIAYHSHRPRTPVPRYDSEGSSDDIWLRPAGAPPRDSAEVRLTDFGWEAGSPDWSPDGTQMVFTSWEKGGKPGASYAWTVTINPRTGHRVGQGRLRLPPPIRGAEMAAWGPTGEIAIEERSAPGRHTLWIIRTDRSAPRKVVEYAMPTYGGVDWSPDGRTLVYSAVTGTRMQLFAVPAAGGEPRQLTADSANLLHPQISPDGKLIAASRLLQHKEIWRARLQP